ncbi:electron transporter RnfG [Achromatium sp. WMS2]|nr:electron transporter RnfG [Achromatium sp. WMS2]
MLDNNLLRTAAILAAFAGVSVTLVAVIHEVTKTVIAHNEQRSLLNKLSVLVPTTSIDNDIINDILVVQAPSLLGANSSVVYRGRKHGQPVAVIVNTTVPDGYAGPIKLLVAVGYDGTLRGVRVVSHKETPGLGDRIEEQKTNWILDFNGKSIVSPPANIWAVKRDGGDFDQLTGATVTSRAVVKAVKNTLLFVEQQGSALYSLANLGQ